VSQDDKGPLSGPLYSIATQCLYCQHYEADQFGAACPAFPSAIPDEITTNRFDHRKPHPDEIVPVRLEFREDVPADVVAAVNRRLDQIR
jgi:hypothetical protein